MKRIVLVLMLLLVLSAALPAFAQDAVASVNTGSLNVRTGPGMQYGSVAALPFGFGVQMVARNAEGNWIQIALTNGVTGWVNLNYIFTQYPTHNLPISESPVPATVTPTAVVTGALNLLVYNGPSMDNAVIATVPAGTRIILLGRNYNSTLAQVQLADEAVGWVQATALTATVPVRSLALADGSVFVPYAPSLPISPTTGGTNGGTSSSYQTYVVLPGDSLSTIAQHFGVSMSSIAALNNIWNYNLIYVDQQLIIPA